MSQSQKIFNFGVSKNYEWILRHMFRWFHFLSLWQMMPKIVEFVFVFIVNVTWICQTKKKLCMGSQKFTNGYLRIHTDGLKCLNLWQMVAKIIQEYFSKS